jgi:hypothetical protein
VERLAVAGRATFALAIPANPALAGFVAGAQALVLDPSAPSALGSLSNAGILRVY